MEVDAMQCSRCQKSITDSQSYVHNGRVYCEDCLMDIGLNTRECDPWATYVDNRTRERAGQTGTEGLTELEQKVYNYVKQKGKATRQDVMNGLNMSETELRTQLIPLLHSELIKEKSEDRQQYLVVIN